MLIKLVYIEKFTWLSELCNKDEELYFGPVAVDIINEKESKEVIKRGTKRIQENFERNSTKIFESSC